MRLFKPVSSRPFLSQNQWRSVSQESAALREQVHQHGLSETTESSENNLIVDEIQRLALHTRAGYRRGKERLQTDL